MLIDLGRGIAVTDNPPSPPGGPGPSLTVTVEHRAAALVVHVAGEIDLVTEGEFRESVRQALAEHPDRLVLDLSDLRFMSSSGLKVLLEARGSSSGTDLRLVATEAVTHPMTIVGADMTLAVYPSVQDALRDQPPRGQAE